MTPPPRRPPPRALPVVARLAVLAALAGCGGAARVDERPAAAEPITARCRPGQPCWPSEADWQQLRARLRGALEPVQSPLAPCRADPASEACTTTLRSMKNPFYLQDQPGGTETAGWLDAWTAAPSAYAVVAETAVSGSCSTKGPPRAPAPVPPWTGRDG